MTVTSFSEIITAAMQVIDDVKWREELRTNAAQFFRAKSQTVLFSLPLLSKPPELLSYLENGMTAPGYDDMEYTSYSGAEKGESVTIQTGKIGFSICSASMRSEDGTEAYPADVEYNADTGEATLTLAASGAQEYSLDFYRDGGVKDLTATMLRLFSLAVAVTWDERFQRDWLANTMKIHDASFETVNESNYMDKTNARYLANKQAFEDELRDYEQKCAYASVTGFSGRRGTKLI